MKTHHTCGKVSTQHKVNTQISKSVGTNFYRDQLHGGFTLPIGYPNTSMNTFLTKGEIFVWSASHSIFQSI
jgi:hypothetical protein